METQTLMDGSRKRLEVQYLTQEYDRSTDLPIGIYQATNGENTLTKPQHTAIFKKSLTIT